MKLAKAIRKLRQPRASAANLKVKSTSTKTNYSGIRETRRLRLMGNADFFVGRQAPALAWWNGFAGNGQKESPA